ncbi:M20/M25/M40 family metallo-hydrolase [Vitreimonas flagellata]|uniref:M20/M25/M40 family metallo-hydrolase n=1 Tax=Vitreimonas flagellata TaxID=2560861 RepID=UPI001074D5AE|nr:M20/M25/M40 family metallo-hydrolase [Vitreimonas flagellata]
MDRNDIPPIDQVATPTRRSLWAGAAALAPLAFAEDADAATPNRAALRRIVDQQKDETIALLQDWIRNPTIAAESLNIQEGADYMARLARDAGFQTAEIVSTDGSPGVWAALDVGAPKTLAVYFMYDVKQFNPEEWSSPPLEARLVDNPLGRILVGRGAVNQKGPEIAFLAALRALRAAGRQPPVNIVLICEGEEEIGSPHFHQIVRRPDIMQRLQSSVGVFIPSAWQDPSTGSVSVNLGAKGIIECELIASGESWGRGPTRDIHSSTKAMVDSPVWRLVRALDTLTTEDGNTPAIDGWFENVRPLTARERELIQQGARNSSEADWKQRNGVSRFIDDLPWAQALERLASQPTVNIEGLVAGYTGPGGMTILPGRGVAKLDFRLVPNQTRAEAEAKLRAHLDARGFSDVQVVVSGGYDPTETAEDSAIVQAQLAVYRRAGARATLNPRLAGSWPGAVFTAAPVSLPAGQFGLGHGGGAHAPNEYLLIDSNNSRVQGLTGAVMGFIDIMYELAR